MAGAIRSARAVHSALRRCFAWQAPYFILPCEGWPPWGAGRLAWQAQYFLRSDAVSRRRRSALCTLMLFRSAGAVLYAKAGRRGGDLLAWQAQHLRGRRNTLCTQAQ